MTLASMVVEFIDTQAQPPKTVTVPVKVTIRHTLQTFNF